MTKRHDVIYSFGADHGRAGCCRLRIYHGTVEARPVVVATQVAVNSGTSITSLAEELALRVWQEFLADVPLDGGFLWVEHYPAHGRHYEHSTKGRVYESAEEFDWVTFGIGQDRRTGRCTLVHPAWTHTDRATVEAVLGQHVE